MKQRTLAMMNGFERYGKKTRRAAFLEEMEQVVPWAELCAPRMRGKSGIRRCIRRARASSGISG